MENTNHKIQSHLTSLEEIKQSIPDSYADTDIEKNALRDMQKALLNILDDYSEQNKFAEETQKILINILEDYTAEKASIEKMNLMLKRSNKEIEQFAYIASHDLQEPLKTLSNYVSLFKRKYEGSLDKDADHYLAVISRATVRMQALIKDLLDYSKIDKDKNRTAIDCNLLLHDIQNDMNLSISESETEIHFKQLPILNGYLSGLTSLFQNLISNAIKFRKSGVNPIITISAEEEDTEWVFAIKDNGIGIDKIYFKKLFIVFQRLHNKDEYAGTGIGLAQCKKIIELHGGRIWLDSELDNGSTFYFTIPKTIIQ